MSEFDVGDRLKCNSPGSWVHGRIGTVLAVDVESSDGIRGYSLAIDGANGYTVLSPAEVGAIPDLAAVHRECGDLIEQAAHLIRQAAIKLSGLPWSGMLSSETSELHELARRVRDYDPTGD